MAPGDNVHERLLAFDILRILGIFFIVLMHLVTVTDKALAVGYRIPNIYTLDAGTLGVSLFLFVSGALLEYNYGDKLKLNSLAGFYIKRLVRIYPAYWISLVLGLIVAPGLLASQPKLDLALQFSGFAAFANKWGGPINGVGWFIGLIVVLYLLYPLLSRAIKAHPHSALIAILFISLASRYLLNLYHMNPTMERWFPTGNMFEFGLGIWIVRQGLYPKAPDGSRTIRLASDLCFYVFLVHFPIRQIAATSIPFYLLATITLAFMLYSVDGRIKEYLMERIGKFARAPIKVNITPAGDRQAGRGQSRETGDVSPVFNAMYPSRVPSRRPGARRH